MRLTLRTLLAYLDDLLEPGQSREIGEKISESGYASALVDRIREVMRRRRLTAPDPKSPNSGLEINSVAEYLDNTLSPEAVADVEKVCLDSDVHLAEVAASHQILTLVLGEPVDVPTKTRERMYALGPIVKPAGSNGRANAEGDSQVGSDSSVATPARPPVDDEGSSVDSFPTTIPDYLKPVPVWRRLAPVAVGVTIGAIWLGVVYFDPSLWFGPSSGAGENVVQLERDVFPEGVLGTPTGTQSATLPGEGDAGVDGGSATSPGGNTDVLPGGQTEPKVLASNTPPKGIDNLNGFDPEARPANSTPPQPVTPTLPAAGTTVAAVTSPASTGSSVSAPSTTSPVTATPATATPPATAGVTETPATIVAAAVPAPEVLYTSREGVLARQSDEGWLTMSHRTAIRSGERVASLEPFSALLEVSSLNLLIELQGGSVIEFLGATKDDQILLRLLAGRISVQRRSTGEDAKPIAIGLQLLDEPCRLTLHSTSALCGVELMVAESIAYEKELGEDRYTGNLFVVNGQVSFDSELSGDVRLTEPSWIPLTPKDRRALAESKDRPPLLTVPEWLDPSSTRISSTQRRYATRFQNEIDEEQPLRDSVPTIVNSKIPGISEFAVKTMAVTGMHDQLVQVLAEAEFLESRTAAIAGLRRWLPAAVENREALRAELQRHFPADQVDTLYRLLWGYNNDDAHNPATSRLLVDWLGHDNVVIRQLAFQNVYRLTGQRYDYRPINPLNQRRVAVERWYSHLERNGGSLIE
jgi:hypothetical protein